MHLTLAYLNLAIWSILGNILSMGVVEVKPGLNMSEY